MTTKKKISTKKAAKGKAEGNKPKLTPEQKAEIDAKAEAFKVASVAYAKTAYDAALAHFAATEGDPFTRSRLAVVYEETNEGDVHMVVTLPGFMRDSAVRDEDVRGWIHDAELLARTLEHPKCTEAFKDAFGAIYTEHMLDGSGISWTTPEVVRVMLPLVMLAGSGTNHVCDDSTAFDILKTLSSELIDDHAGEQVRAVFRG
jgi:hypothetical protein